MLSLGRTLIVMAVGLTVVYLSLFFYLRSGARMRLEEDWVHEGRPGERDDWVEERLAPHVRRIRVRLAVLVYVVPILGVTALVWAIN
jgi:hypothetical protein